MARTLPNGIRYGFANSGWFVVVDDALGVAHQCHPDSINAREACGAPENVAQNIVEEFARVAEHGGIFLHNRKRYDLWKDAELS